MGFITLNLLHLYFFILTSSLNLSSVQSLSRVRLFVTPQLNLVKIKSLMRDWSEAQKPLSNSALLRGSPFRDPYAHIIVELYYFSDFKFGLHLFCKEQLSITIAMKYY